MVKKIFYLISLFIFTACAHTSESQEKLIPWGSPYSQTLLNNAESGDFFQLSNYFEPQINKFACGLASGTVILNYLASTKDTKDLPLDESNYPIKENFLGKDFVPVFPKHTQKTFLNSNTEHIKPLFVFYGKPKADGQQDGGLSLDQFSAILKSYHLNVRTFHTSSLDKKAELKKIMIDALRDKSTFVVANFDRKKLAQAGNGHLSPVVAYHFETDRVLILDVNPKVSPWFWVKFDDLFEAMNTLDGNTYRGFATISNGE